MKPDLTPEQRAQIDRLLNEAVERQARAAGRSAVQALGDKMAAAKKPFWRRLVGFFRR
jgi:hypothetical protein